MSQQTGRLHNKVAIVTGASSGIGRATAKLFAAEGAKVVAGARRESELANLVAEIKASGGTFSDLRGLIGRAGMVGRGIPMHASQRVLVDA